MSTNAALPTSPTSAATTCKRITSTILMPTDFSDSAAKTLVWAAKYLVHHNDKVILLHAIEEMHVDDDMTQPDKQVLYQGAERKLNEWAQELRRQLHGKHATIETKVAFGSAGVATVTKAAKIKPDLVVVGIHGQTDTQSAVMGPVANYISTYLRGCPLFIVRDKVDEEAV
ncbi:hypothetical protein BASA50_002853 [Batrachochytrium salamandrivorans]|uniref:UspA domain-containing protein n=1 Tax=Batrachochytrium salamandrivorans TaxID=1357716 RepID=A0ABQ8FN58_9FUNG|nr:hypothetical protein BASA60_008292 [Batrachochytrium salamandrivorans]KAH6576399.1 hypothetical protein BASA62_001448 [Batrachochytrium salamandrivorans]KAH6579511.1 hypothetical protein BASA61_010193 [Batrachochytrium salamandrivorans]KAH6599656.1 hypothetical protein BASA50_002853 [Batrachochytrium salamandrivorans]KAH9247210.1 hypothetical protein BASA81_015206 [Batrachochytrium salamandrivorans]